MAALDDPARDAWQKPHEVVTALGLRDGDAVADIGAGSGYFALRFARHVGPQGRVYAVDVSPDMVAEVSRRAKAAGLDLVTTALATPDDPFSGKVPRIPDPLGRAVRGEEAPRKTSSIRDHNRSIIPHVGGLH